MRGGGALIRSLRPPRLCANSFSRPIAISACVSGGLRSTIEVERPDDEKGPVEKEHV
jgi:hypothetical protein